ncbi:MAG: glycoside hydrolase family 3 C-terminal domain-containing protein [Prevotella sp.]|nr:glycoside hydrolase family 3 C-terminal domain-containing protein [Prevotella sp.]
MKKLFLLGLLTLLTASCNKQEPTQGQDPEIEAQVAKTLDKLTLEEKIGQMMQLVTDLFGTNDADGVFHIDPAKADTLFSKYKIGSILNAPNTCAPTAEQWEEIIADIQQLSLKHIGVPCLFGLDQNHGSTYTQGGTLFPQNINVAATFNRDIARKCAEATAYETRAVSVPWTFSPTIDLARDARWPRFYENFGEDCYVNAEMGVAQTLGFQGEDPNHVDQQHVAVSLKHYMGYSVPWSGKDRTPAYIAPSQLREKFFAPFLACVKAGAHSIMVNSASVNGMPVHANRELLTGWLKEQTGWDGVLITDWADVNNLFTREMVAKDKKDALRIAINAGIDMIMEPYNVDACILLKELVDEGKVSMTRIDDAVSRVLRMKYRLGLFSHPTQRLADYPKFGGEEFAQLAFEGAVESIVLLKNEGNILPLCNQQELPSHQGEGAGVGSHQRILLTGPNANQMRCLNGGWSYTWQGHRTDEFASQYNTIYEAFCNEFGEGNVRLEQGVTYNEKGKYWEENQPDINAAVRAAQGVDVIVACIGENSYTETPGNLTDLTLSENQRNLVKALAKTGKPIILVLNEGRPRIISDIVPLAQAVVHIMLPGNYGGDALAALCSGRCNFSGRLPFTYPSEINSLANYDFKKSEESGTMEGAYDYNARITQQWGFGTGFSYTTFEYTNLKVDKEQFTKDDVLNISVDITNTGQRSGKESVLLYSSDLIASMVPDGRRLRQFQKIELQPGEKQTVTFQLPARNLAFVGYDGRWTIEQGEFILTVGGLTTKIVCNETYTF